MTQSFSSLHQTAGSSRISSLSLDAFIDVYLYWPVGRSTMLSVSDIQSPVMLDATRRRTGVQSARRSLQASAASPALLLDAGSC